MKSLAILLVFAMIDLSQSKHNFFRTGRRNNLYVVFSKYDINKLAKRKAGLIVAKKQRFAHKGSKK